MTTSVDEKSVFSENALKILRERYFYIYDKGTPEERQETEEEFFDRISMGNPEYRKMLSNLDFLPNSPTLFNMGIEGSGTLSACFKFDVQDTMESENFDGIMDVGIKAARVLKWGGGVGYALHVRPRGASISTTHGKAMGPVAVLGHYDEIANMVTQGGKREGAQMAILHCDHPDIREFIHCKDGGKNLKTFNISVALTDSFMDAATTQSESDEAKLLHEMAESAWRTGDPGVFFIDRAERDNPAPWSGKLTGTNPCGEVPLEDNEACNLGSTNYGNFVLDRIEIDYDRLEYTIRLATRYLDDVLDRNVFPDPQVEAIVRKNRKLGLGACGVADAFALMKIPYASEEAVSLSHSWAKNASDIALDESRKMADEKGIAPTYENVRGVDIPLDGIATKGLPRNTTRTCIAPTGTIAILMRASSGIEPHYEIEWDRQLGGEDGELLHERIPVWDQLDGFVPQTAMEVPWEWHIKHQAAWQENTDLAVSKTINLPQNAPVEDIYSSYVKMWEMDCVGGTVYRDKSRDEQVLTSVGESYAKAADDSSSAPLTRRKLPDVRESVTRKVTIGGTKLYMVVGKYPDGSPGELFLNASRRGSTEDALLDAVAMLTSYYLQNGGGLEYLRDKFAYSIFEPSGLTSDPEIPKATSMLDYVFRRMGLDFLDTEAKLMNTGMSCPQCGAGVKIEEGCESCVNMCGWSRC